MKIQIFKQPVYWHENLKFKNWKFYMHDGIILSYSMMKNTMVTLFVDKKLAF
jgi:hypothetical protein